MKPERQIEHHQLYQLCIKELQKEKEAKIIFEEVMVPNFPNFIENIKPQIQEAPVYSR